MNFGLFDLFEHVMSGLSTGFFSADPVASASRMALQRALLTL